jgi:hypothetical protein
MERANAGEPVRGAKVAVRIGGYLRKVVTTRVRAYLLEGQWPEPGNRRTKVGAVTKERREAANAELIAAMQRRPGARANWRASWE